MALTSGLTLALKKAALGSEAEIEIFFKILLSSTVYVPRIPKKNTTIPIIGSPDPENNLAFAIIKFDGKKILPFFSEVKYLVEWGTGGFEIDTIPFSKLLYAIDTETFLHLDSNQDFGKEISPWEISLLKMGEAAIGDVIADLMEAKNVEIIVNEESVEFNFLIPHLRPIFEAYGGVLEGYLCALKEEDESRELPVIGILFGENFEHRDVLVQELEELSKSLLPPESQISILSDLHQENSPSRGIFLGMEPFYSVQEN